MPPKKKNQGDDDDGAMRAARFGRVKNTLTMGFGESFFAAGCVCNVHLMYALRASSNLIVYVPSYSYSGSSQCWEEFFNKYVGGCQPRGSCQLCKQAILELPFISSHLIGTTFIGLSQQLLSLFRFLDEFYL